MPGYNVYDPSAKRPAPSLAGRLPASTLAALGGALPSSFISSASAYSPQGDISGFDDFLTQQPQDEQERWRRYRGAFSHANFSDPSYIRKKDAATAALYQRYGGTGDYIDNTRYGSQDFGANNRAFRRARNNENLVNAMSGNYGGDYASTIAALEQNPSLGWYATGSMYH